MLDFLISKHVLGSGLLFGVSLKGKTFDLDLVPKNKKCNIHLSILIPIDIHGNVLFSFSSHELLKLSNEICATKFIEERLNSSYDLVRIRVAGKNFHWDSEEVNELRSKLVSKGIKTVEPRFWTQVIMDSHSKKMLSFYLLSGQNISVADHSILEDSVLKREVEKGSPIHGVSTVDSGHLMFGIINPRPVVFIPIIKADGKVQLVSFENKKP